MLYGQALARTFGSKIYVTHAVPPYPPVFLLMEPVPIELDSMWQYAKQSLSPFLGVDVLKNIKHEGILERGELWNVLDDVIHRHSVDLIILGTHGKHGLKKCVLGSASEQIFRKASCPVLTIGSHVRKPPADGALFKQIIFATDFSAGIAARPALCSLASRGKSGASHPAARDPAGTVERIGSDCRQCPGAPGRTHSARSRRLVSSGLCGPLRVPGGRRSHPGRVSTSRPDGDGSPESNTRSRIASTLGDRLRGRLPRHLPSPDRPRLNGNGGGCAKGRRE